MPALSICHGSQKTNDHVSAVDRLYVWCHARGVGWVWWGTEIGRRPEPVRNGLGVKGCQHGAISYLNCRHMKYPNYAMNNVANEAFVGDKEKVIKTCMLCRDAFVCYDLFNYIYKWYMLCSVFCHTVRNGRLKEFSHFWMFIWQGFGFRKYVSLMPLWWSIIKRAVPTHNWKKIFFLPNKQMNDSPSWITCLKYLQGDYHMRRS